MRSGISFFDKTLFKKTVARWWPIWASYLVLWIFILPVHLAMTGEGYRSEISGTFVPQMVITMIFALFAAMAVLSHLYWPRSANFFGSLPVRREAQFVTLYLAGLSFLLAPDVIVACLTALAVSGSKVLAVGQAFAWLLTAAVDGFFFYSFAIVVGLLVGHILALPALYTAFNFLAALVELLLEMVAGVFYPSFVGFPQAADKAVLWLTPSFQLIKVQLMTVSYEVYPGTGSYIEEFVNDGSWRFYGGHILAIYAGVAAVLTVLAFFLYRHRRMESAGDAVAVRAVRPVFKYGGALCAGLGLGVITSLILGEKSMPYTVTAWTVLSVFVAQMILDKTFRVFKKWKGAAVLGALVAAAFVVMACDLTGFESRVPDPADVESVKVSYMRTSSALGDWADYADFTVTDPEEIRELTDLHEAAVREGEGHGAGYVSMSITYRLKHATMRRSVSVRFDPNEAHTPGTVAAAAEAVFADRDLWRRIYGLDELEDALAAGGRIYEADYGYSVYSWDEIDPDDPEQQYKYLRDGGMLTILNAEDISALTDALLADFEDGLIGRRRADRPMVNDGKTQRSVTLAWTFGDDSDSIRFALTPEAKRTYDLIQALIPRLLEEQGLEK